MMQELENSHKPPPTPSDGIHPYPLGNPDADKYLVLLYHDESTFHSNEGVSHSWHEKGKYPLQPKDQGRGIMVTDFLNEFNGLLQLSYIEISRRDEDGSDVPMLAREVLYIGAENEGYFTSENFCAQVSKAANIAAFKYSHRVYDVIFVVDEAKIHTAFDDVALIASRMTVGPGGKQPVMQPSPSYLIKGASQRMPLDDGRPKGLKIVLEERA